MKRVRMIPRLFVLSIVLVCVSYPVMSADAKKVIIQNITLNVTVIIPITVVAQNAQICISLASSGDQTCQQITLDPTQTTLTPISVDLTEQAPLITSGSSNQTGTTGLANQTGTTTATPSNDTSSSAGNSNRSFEPGKSNNTNPTNDPESKSSQNDQSADSQPSAKENTKEDKDTNEQEQGESTGDESTENENSEEP